ncbi:putative signal peptidase I-2 [Porphyridium purpureum]|uniref:Mitochondrial inner membrane protease subunit n=1 Tax=Porphyridium purpureum TaxID=35688 RepID=A0A5J4YRP0_PORPP|nr:putative signal peptidase I-2 [Porphyridium purpureum]|eukprot:POR1752..scf229_5
MARLYSAHTAFVGSSPGPPRRIRTPASPLARAAPAFGAAARRGSRVGPCQLIVARTRGERSQAEHEPWTDEQRRDLVAFAAATLIGNLVALGLFCLFGAQVASVYAIPTTSMVPTLNAGDGLLVEKLSIHVRPPQNNEIVLFHPPEELVNQVHKLGGHVQYKDTFVKRVAASGGDVVHVTHGQVLINSKFVESADAALEYGPVTVPHGYFFVLGDNECRSVDSRYFGFVSEDLLIGRPMLRCFPLNKLGALPAFSRASTESNSPALSPSAARSSSL